MGWNIRFYRSSDDPAIAASALACVARVAASHRIMPLILLQSGVCDAVVKLIKHHVAHGQVLHHGALSIHIMSSDNPEVRNLPFMHACISTGILL